MSIIYNNTTVKSIVYNNNTIKSVNYNGVNVFKASGLITFNSNGGNAPTQSSIEAEPGVSYTIPTCTRNATGTANTVGYTTYSFLGWYDSPTGGNKILNASGTFTFNSDQAYDRILYAHWYAKKISSVASNITVYPTSIGSLNNYDNNIYISTSGGRYGFVAHKILTRGNTDYGFSNTWVSFSDDGKVLHFSFPNKTNVDGLSIYNITYSQSGYNSVTNYSSQPFKPSVQPTYAKYFEYTLPTATLTPVNKYSYTYEYINGN